MSILSAVEDKVLQDIHRVVIIAVFSFIVDVWWEGVLSSSSNSIFIIKDSKKTWG